MHIVKFLKIKIRSKFDYNMQHTHTNEKDDIINLKSNFSHPWNVWNDDMDDEIGDMCPLIPFTNTLNIENIV